MITVGALAIAVATVAVAGLPLAPAWRPTRIHPLIHPDGAALADAGWRLSYRRWEAIRLAAVAAGMFVLAMAGGPLPLGLGAAALPSIAARLRAQAAHDRARGPATQVLVAAAAALRSGLPLGEALRQALAGCNDRLAREPIETVIARFDLGEPLDHALISVARQMPAGRPAAALEALALGVHERLPIERIAALLGAVTDRLLFEERLADEVAARAAGARLQMWLLAGLVPALALYLSLSMPALAMTLGGPLGRSVLIPLALVLEISGVVVSRRIVRRASS